MTRSILTCPFRDETFESAGNGFDVSAYKGPTKQLGIGSSAGLVSFQTIVSFVIIYCRVKNANHLATIASLSTTHMDRDQLIRIIFYGQQSRVAMLELSGLL